MNIVVCIKQVPDTTEVKLDPKTGTLIREGIPSIINPDDKGALELALQLKDKYNAHVTVLTMGLPQVSYLLDLEVDGKKCRVKKSTEEGYQILETEMPCVFTVLATANKARYMTVNGIVEAYNREVEIWNADKTGTDENLLGLKGSPTRVFKSFTKALKPAGETYEVSPEEAVDLIISKLKEKFII